MGGLAGALIVLLALIISTMYMFRANQRSLERRQERSEAGMAALKATIDSLYPTDPMNIPEPLPLPKEKP